MTTKRRHKPAPAPMPTRVLPMPSQTALAVLPMAVLQRAVQDGAAVDVLERLLALQERWEATQARKAFDAAMSALRGDLPRILKGREVDFTTDKGRTHYRYEDLAAVIAAISPPMAKHGLSFRWHTDSSHPGAISVTCIVSHAAGHAERTTLSAAPDTTGNKNSIQAIGSAVAYLQRYTLKAAVGVAAAEDDGGQAGSRGRSGATAPAVGYDRGGDRPITDRPRRNAGDHVGQVQRLWILIKKSGRSTEEVKAWLAVAYGLDSTKKIKRSNYDAICQAVQAPGPLPKPAAFEEREPGQEG